ncbi:hypothetical protein AB0D37_42900 [Streptomyces sp. NPDC048384]|uniref:hypothetical protein n=1 Tax=Streptomyces sp. NPDC048384 TaxID=3155487 RepID=UPI00341BC0A9
MLHPAELAWIAERPKARTGSSTRRPPSRRPRTKTTVCCDCSATTNSTSTPTQRPSWLDSAAVDEFVSRSEVYRAVVASRHLTLEHLRQIPAEEILSRHEPEVAGRPEDPAGPLRAQHRSVEGTRRCHEYDEEKISFGELLESLDGTPARAQTS